MVSVLSKVEWSGSVKLEIVVHLSIYLLYHQYFTILDTDPLQDDKILQPIQKVLKKFHHSNTYCSHKMKKNRTFKFTTVCCCLI